MRTGIFAGGAAGGPTTPDGALKSCVTGSPILAAGNMDSRLVFPRCRVNCCHAFGVGPWARALPATATRSACLARPVCCAQRALREPSALYSLVSVHAKSAGRACVARGTLLRSAGFPVEPELPRNDAGSVPHAPSVLHAICGVSLESHTLSQRSCARSVSGPALHRLAAHRRLTGPDRFGMMTDADLSTNSSVVRYGSRGYTTLTYCEAAAAHTARFATLSLPPSRRGSVASPVRAICARRVFPSNRFRGSRSSRGFHERWSSYVCRCCKASKHPER